MAISDKLTYLNTTKTLIREGLNNLGASLTLSDTFRSYVNVLSNLYDYLPKVTGSGTTVTLNDTKKGLMRITLDPSELSQSSTPSPSSPQTIHSTSGNNTIQIMGKNMFNELATQNPKTGITISQDRKSVTVDFSAGNDMYFFIMRNFENPTTQAYSVYFEVSGLASGEQPRYNLWSSGTYFTLKNGKNVAVIPSGTTSNNGVILWDDQSRTQYPVSSTVTFTNFMIVRGEFTEETIGNYMPYEEPIDYSINLGNIKYCKISTNGDRIFKNISNDSDYDNTKVEGGWYYKQAIGKYTLPNNIGGYNSGSNWYYIGTSNFANINTTSGTPIICNYFENINLQATGNENANGIYNIGTHIVIRNTTLTSLNEYRTWLSNNEVIMETPLSTPTYTQITGTLAEELEAVYNAQSKDGQTNISQINNDLAFIINSSALQDLS